MNDKIRLLKRQIEISVAKTPVSPKDFEELRERIFALTGSLVSPTTLKRLWGYLEENISPRVYTLSILARFVGFRDWEHFCSYVDNQTTETESNPVMARHINVAKDLCKGDTVILRWLPDRVCKVVYKGELTFEIIESVNTRLMAGQEFTCAFIIEGEPLYINGLTTGKTKTVGYVCGKRNGVSFEIKPKDKVV